MTLARPRLLRAVRELSIEKSQSGRFMIVQGTAKDLKIHPKTAWRWIDEVKSTLATVKPAKLRCVECGEYRRVHRRGGHPFVDGSPASNANYWRWAQAYMTEAERHQLVDGIRAVLRLAPIYTRERGPGFRVFPDPDHRERKLLRSK